VKALSLWQPWASLWSCGRKIYETRSWSTNYAGPIAVHAAKRIETEISDMLREICENEFGGRWHVELPAGALIAVCDCVICKPTDHLHVDDEEFAQGNFTPGRFAFDPLNMRELPTPISWRGMQGLFDIPDNLIVGVPLPPAARQGSLL
jgi:hypothetical protein